METSILKTTKKMLGLDDSYTVFDLDVITHINAVFAELNDLGVGPTDGFMIEDATPTWGNYVPDDNRINAVKSYMYLRVRMLFDPPQNAFAQTAMEAQVAEMQWRINVRREATDYVSPFPPPALVGDDDVVVDGGEV